MSTSFSTHCPHCKKLSEFQSSTVNGYFSFTCPSCHKVFYVLFKNGKQISVKK